MTEPTCPPEDDLRRLLDDALAADEAARLQSHIEGCPSCQQKLDALGAGKQSWAEAADHLRGELSAAPEPALEKVVQALEAQGEPSRPANDGPGKEEVFSVLKPSPIAGNLGRLGPYEVTQVLGRGDMGVVLKAIDENLRRVVAIKVLSPQLASSGSARTRFKREAQAAAAVCHENIVTIHAVDEEDGTPYLVMQLVSGITLQDLLDNKGALELRETLRVGYQIASGLAADSK